MFLGQLTKKDPYVYYQSLDDFSCCGIPFMSELSTSHMLSGQNFEAVTSEGLLVSD